MCPRAGWEESTGRSLGEARTAIAEERRLITIDGPAGCGKSTVMRALAARLDGVAFSSGCVYRAVTYGALNAGVNLEDPGAVVAWVAAGHLQLVSRPADAAVGTVGEICVEIDGADPGDALHTPEVTAQIHWVANAAELRQAVLACQREIESESIIIAEGRDLGTVVYPDAPVKIFLTASIEVRARRRWQQWGEEHDLAEVIADMERRDQRDRERDVSPLIPAADAVTVDASDLTVDEVVAAIEKEIPDRWRARKPHGST